MSPAAPRALKKIPPDLKRRLWRSLERLAETVAEPGRVGGKRVKRLQGMDETFHRLRVGDHRIMFDVLESERVILILGIVHRADLERWIRNR